MSIAPKCMCGNNGYFCDGSEGCFYAKEEEEENNFWKRQVDIVQLQSRIIELEAENFKLAAYQCHNPISSEYGDMLCKDVMDLRAENKKLREALDYMIAEFDVFGKTAPQNRAMAAAKALSKQKEEQ